MPLRIIVLATRAGTGEAANATAAVSPVTIAICG